MADLSRYLFLAGGLPFVVLGLIHVFVTPRSPGEKKPLSPSDASLRDAMTRDTLMISRRMSFWSAWVGFNLSHSLGAVLFGSAVLLIGRSAASFAQQAPLFIPFAVVVSAIYLVLAVRYWFRSPLIGIMLSCACFVSSWIAR
jgi:hypothetical protein